GRLYLKRYDLTGERTMLDKGVVIARKALSSRPTDEDALSLGVRAERGLGMYFNNRSDGDQALGHFRAALSVSEKWSELVPGDAADRNVASVLAHIADAALRKGDPGLAVRTADRMQAMREKMLAAQPGDVTHIRQVFKAQMMRGYALGHPDHFNLGSQSEALTNFRAALRIAQQLL